jgi:hypothetical protein
MEILLFSANGILVYLLANWIVRIIAEKRGGDLPYRQVVFFIVFFALILISFEALKYFLAEFG